MERARTGPFPLVVPALVVLPLAGLALCYGAWRWFQADARAGLSRRLSDAAAAVERQVDAAVQRQADATRTLATSPTTWLWVKFQGQRLTVSNRAHAEAALASLTSFSGLLPGLSLYLASEHTRTVYEAGSAVAAITRDDPASAWYPASLASENVVITGDSRSLRTSMRVMNGRELIGAVSCVTDLSTLGAGALAISEEERDLTFVLADASGAILLARGPGASAAATVSDLVDARDRARMSALLAAPARPGEISTAELSAKGRRLLAAATLTGAPGWRVLVSSDLAGLPVGRTLLIIAVAAVALLLIAGAILLIGSRRARETEELIDHLGHERDSLQVERDNARAFAHELGAAALRLRDAAARLSERVGALASEAASGKAGTREALAAIQEAEERSAELRSGITARLPLLDGLASSIRQLVGKTREPGDDGPTDAERTEPASDAGMTSASASASSAEEEINVILTTGSAVTLALDNAGKGASEMEAAAERARIVALNAALESSRPGGRRQGSAQAADEMRRIAEDAASAARSLVSALEEARTGMRAVSRAAQAAGRMSHEAAAALRQEPAAEPEAGRTGAETQPDRGPGDEEDLQALRDQLARLEAANLSANALRSEATSADRSRSAAEGVARVMERVETLCGEIAALASSVSRETSKAAGKAPFSGGSDTHHA